MSRLGIQDEVDNGEGEWWRWHYQIKAGDSEGLFHANINIAGHFFSYFLFATSTLQIIALFMGEKSEPIKVCQ